jgi:hypothetical protein
MFLVRVIESPERYRTRELDLTGLWRIGIGGIIRNFWLVVTRVGAAGVSVVTGTVIQMHAGHCHLEQAVSGLTIMVPARWLRPPDWD